MRYEDEATHPLGRSRPSDPVRFDASLHAFFTTLGRLRTERGALRRGSIETVIADDAKRVFAFRRALGDDAIVAVFNGSERPQSVDVPLGAGTYRDLLTGKRHRTRSGVARVTLPALTAAFLARHQ
jgi:alpha-glucosidase